MPKTNPQTIDDYINTFPEEVQERLEKVRQTIHKVVPEAQEDIKWNRPAFVGKTILVMFGGFKIISVFTLHQALLKFLKMNLRISRPGKAPFNSRMSSHFQEI